MGGHHGRDHRTDSDRHNFEQPVEQDQQQFEGGFGRRHEGFDMGRWRAAPLPQRAQSGPEDEGQQNNADDFILPKWID